MSNSDSPATEMSNSDSPATETSNSDGPTTGRATSVSSALTKLRTARQQAYRNRTAVDFSKIWPRMLLISVVLILISVGSFLLRGVNLGIEFEGGASWELSSVDTSTSEIRDALRTVGFADARIQRLGNDSYRIRAEIEATNTALLDRVEAALLSNLPDLDADNISRSAVGPSWGDEITNTTRNALIVFFCLIALYIWIRLEWRMTLAALMAVIHDIVVTVGFYSLFQLEVTPATTIAFLTILGYSLYDTLVVFDKIRENENRLAVSRKHTYSQLVVLATNQVMMRSINTTITSVLPVLALLIIGNFVLGAVTLQEFAIALLVGLIAGTYSSLFVATPINAYLKEREEYWVLIRNRLQHRGTEPEAQAQATPVPSIKNAPGPKRPNKRHRITAESRVRTTATHPPRPRKKTK